MKKQVKETIFRVVDQPVNVDEEDLRRLKDGSSD